MTLNTAFLNFRRLSNGDEILEMIPLATCIVDFEQSLSVKFWKINDRRQE